MRQGDGADHMTAWADGWPHTALGALLLVAAVVAWAMVLL